MGHRLSSVLLLSSLKLFVYQTKGDILVYSNVNQKRYHLSFCSPIMFQRHESSFSLLLLFALAVLAILSELCLF